MEWAVADQQALPVKIAVHIGRDRPGLLADISTAISSRQANIVKAEVTVTEDRKGLNHFTVEVKDLDQLQGVMARDLRHQGRHRRRACPRALAARRPPAGPVMVEISRKEFEQLVGRALRRLPRRFRERLENIAVVVEDWADDDTLDEMGVEPPDTLYGLYRAPTSRAATRATATFSRT